MIIGLTGPSGAGKTCVSEYLKTKGFKVIDADKVYHGLLDTCTPMKDKIVNRFGTSDRKELGGIVFADPQALSDLENITHPYVIDAVTSMLDRDGMTVVEAVALSQSGLSELCNCIVYVTAEHETLIGRITERDGISRGYAEARLSNRKHNPSGTYILENNGDLMSLYARVDAIYAEITSKPDGNYVKTI